VPLAHPHIAGLVNLRGQIVTAIDARRRLGVSETSAPPAPTVAVIIGDDEPVGLLVDDAGDVIAVEDRLVEPVPATVSADVRELSIGAYQLDDDLLLLSETDQMIAVAT
jgi:purine-binding chemotaxis protein CheW